MAFKLPSFNLLRRKATSGVAGSKVGSLGNTQINRTGVTKTYATPGAARKANQPGLLSRLKTKLTTPKPRQPIKPLQPKGLSNRAFGSGNALKVRESFGSYNK
jgi:hypothetical protein